MNRATLVKLIKEKNSFLCVGLDTDLQKLPQTLAARGAEGIVEFNKEIIEATLPYAVSYKLNSAFYEALGYHGWWALQQTIQLIPQNEAFIILDAKRGDIGNTSHQYAKAAFEALGAHAVTVAPYMGHDSIMPFLQYPGKWAIVLGLTSNQGADDFQLMKLQNGRYLFEEVMLKTSTWGTTENMMFVTGATQHEQLAQVRQILPQHFLLIPGVGAQGGQLQEVARHTLIHDVGILVNASRSIIYASQGADYKQAAANAAKQLTFEMQHILDTL